MSGTVLPLHPAARVLAAVERAADAALFAAPATEIHVRRVVLAAECAARIATRLAKVALPPRAPLPARRQGALTLAEHHALGADLCRARAIASRASGATPTGRRWRAIVREIDRARDALDDLAVRSHGAVGMGCYFGRVAA